MSAHVYPLDAPLAVQPNGQCAQCGSRDVVRILVDIGRSRQWVLADQIPEGFRVHDCRPELPKAA